MSDWEGYALPLGHKLCYQNTFYDKEPKLDIMNPPSYLKSSLDFVITSDVFEHVPPPVSIAFSNLRKILKPGGVVVFTVPFSKEPKTVEHFPDLYDYQLIKSDNGYQQLMNVTRDGKRQSFHDLVFHGGVGATLEMRIFSERDLLEEFEKAGFKNVTIHTQSYFEYGIYWSEDWSVTISAR